MNLPKFNFPATTSTADQTTSILTLNAGSSSIKFALFQRDEALTPLLNGKLERIALSGTLLTCSDPSGEHQSISHFADSERKSAVNFLIHWLEQQSFFKGITAIGHRIVHGMQHTAPVIIDESLLADLSRFSPYDPEHLPREIELIEALRFHHPDILQVACFDTAFHRTIPRVAKLLAIPLRYAGKGVQRYGFHGLSYSFLMQELVRLGDNAATKGRVILAHLGNGASMAAVQDGLSIDTSMGFTPTGGLPMGTRSGDIDPGLVAYLAHTEQMTTAQFQHMVNHESGLLGVSELSPDMHDLLAEEATEVRAADAVAMFCYQAKKLIGAYSAALGGVDTLVFSGGIGENAPSIRARICENLGFLGIELDSGKNNQNADVISTSSSHTKVRLIRTNEELVIARSVMQIMPAIPVRQFDTSGSTLNPETARAN